MLVVTTTVRMVDGVHSNTTSPGPAVALGSELKSRQYLSKKNEQVSGSTYFMLGSRGLEERLVCSSTTGNNADHTTRRAGKNLLGTRWELDTGLALIRVVANDSHVVAGGTAERTTVTRLVFDVRKDGTFGDRGEREDVADGESGVLSGVDELADVSPGVVPARVYVVFKRTWPVYMPSLAMKVWVSSLNR
jgi:hypothetical protein